MQRSSAAIQARVWGLGRVAALELPAAWGGLVDLPDHPGELDPARLLAVLGGAAGEDSRRENSRQREHGSLCVHAPVLRPGPQARSERAGKLR